MFYNLFRRLFCFAGVFFIIHGVEETKDRKKEARHGLENNFSRLLYAQKMQTHRIKMEYI